MSGKASLRETAGLQILDMQDRWNPKNEDETLWWPRTLWLDPGVVSGVACVWFDPRALLNGEPMGSVVLACAAQYLSGPENGQSGQVKRFLNLVSARGGASQHGGISVGVEQFVLRKMNQDAAFLSPVRIRAGVEFGLSLWFPGVETFAQQPSDAMSSFTNERLRSLRMHTSGPDHINDAKRHALLHLRRISDLTVEQFESIYGHEEEWWN